MANREKGEIALDIGGTTYTLVMDTNAMTRLETLFSTPEREVTFVQIVHRVNGGSLRYLRAFLWAALQRHHPDLTLDAVGDLVDKAGGVIGLARQIAQLGGTTVPAAEDLRTLGVKPGRPRKAQAPGHGTGTGSTVTPGASA